MVLVQNGLFPCQARALGEYTLSRSWPSSSASRASIILSFRSRDIPAGSRESNAFHALARSPGGSWEWRKSVGDKRER